MKFVSLFSGIGGFDLGLEQAGMECVLQVEIDKSCNRVLAHHWPDVERRTDVKDIEQVTADVICGGFPCQDLSVAGKRAGLAGERSGLWFEFHRIIAASAPRYVIIENVPGLLSSSGGRDFAVILRGLAECGYRVAWRVLDAQHFGLAQRRKRVFIVGSLRDGSCAEILFEREGVRGDTPPGREAREEVARTIAPSLTRNYGKQPDNSDTGLGPMLIAATLTGQMPGMSNQWPPINEASNLVVASTIVINLANSGANQNNVKISSVADTVDTWTTQAVASTLGAHPSGRRNNVDETFVIKGAAIGRKPSAGPQYCEILTDGTTYTLNATEVHAIAHALTSGGADASEDGTGRGTPLIGFKWHASATARTMGEIADCVPPITDKQPGVAGTFGVRHLTPTECERLQGFPDGWTGIRSGDWVMSDSARYRMLGNAVAVPVVEWIGRRIMRFV